VASVLTYVSFFITICYHTPFARPWIYPALAFYGLDLFMRPFRFRVKDASLTPMRDMTIVFVPSFFGLQFFVDDVLDSHTQLR
jgi:ferric-chelate reductase